MEMFKKYLHTFNDILLSFQCHRMLNSAEQLWKVSYEMFRDIVFQNTSKSTKRKTKNLFLFDPKDFIILMNLLASQDDFMHLKKYINKINFN